jgi:hypothetical protein
MNASLPIRDRCRAAHPARRTTVRSPWPGPVVAIPPGYPTD